jgi:hypothetical protein
MLVALLILLFLIVALMGAVDLFALGHEAHRRSYQCQGEQARILRCCAWLFQEPAVSTIVLGVLLFFNGTLGQHLAVILCLGSLAAIVLLLTQVRFIQPAYQTLHRHFMLLILARWGTLLVPLVLFRLTLLSFLLSLIGVSLVWYTLRWGQRQLSALVARPLLASPPAYVTQKAPAVPASPLPAVAPGQGSSRITVDTKLLVTLAAATPNLTCPICAAPTPLIALDCSRCGLLFGSRIPASLHTLQRYGYTLLRPLGDGGMSSVYLAVEQHVGQLRAIKTLSTVDGHVDPVWRAQARASLENEAAVLVEIDHPHITRIVDWIVLDQDGVLILDYIDGLPLSQRLTHTTSAGSLIAGSALSPGEALAYSSALAEALCYLGQRSRPLVHCDIKPANVLVTCHDHMPILVDFGGAMAGGQMETARNAGGLYGTPGYAAPEQYQGSFSVQSDVYGLAATLYHLLTDDDPTAHPLRFPQLPMLPPDLAALLGQALTQHPQARPDADQFRTRLHDLANTYPFTPPADELTIACSRPAVR